MTAPPTVYLHVWNDVHVRGIIDMARTSPVAVVITGLDNTLLFENAAGSAGRFGCAWRPIAEGYFVVCVGDSAIDYGHMSESFAESLNS